MARSLRGGPLDQGQGVCGVGTPSSEDSKGTGPFRWGGWGTGPPLLPEPLLGRRRSTGSLRASLNLSGVFSPSLPGAPARRPREASLRGAPARSPKARVLRHASWPSLPGGKGVGTPPPLPLLWGEAPEPLPIGAGASPFALPGNKPGLLVASSRCPGVSSV